MSPYRRADRNLRREGLKAFRLGMFLLERDPRQAETLLRQALRDLVELFLEDREANAALFTLAHRIGLVLVQTFGCPYTWREDTKRWSNDCPIPALHRRVGLSVAWSWSRSCSICGADEFECDHVPGESYDGNVCVLERGRFLGFEHIALTAVPDFAYTFMQSDEISPEQVSARFGRPLGEGERLFCNHCRNCSGYFGPTADDLDPSRWEPLDADDATEAA